MDVQIDVGRAVGELLDARRDTIAWQIAEQAYEQDPELPARYGSYGLNEMASDMGSYLRSLASAMRLDTPLLFSDYLSWFVSVLESRGMEKAKIQGLLELAREVTIQSLPPNYEAPLREYLSRVEGVMRGGPTAAASLEGPGPLHALSRDYLGLLLGNEHREAAARLLALAQAGMPVTTLYLEVLQPALYEVGRLWQLNQINVAQEHYVTTATRSIMAQLYRLASPSPQPAPTVVIASAEGEAHQLGCRMLADVFEIEAWNVHLLDMGIRPEELEEALDETRPDLLALSVTMPWHLPRVEALIAGLRAREAFANVKIMVGGMPFNRDETLWRRIGADAWAPDPLQAVSLANRLCLVEPASALFPARQSPGTALWCTEEGTNCELLRDDLMLRQLFANHGQRQLSDLNGHLSDGDLSQRLEQARRGATPSLHLVDGLRNSQGERLVMGTRACDEGILVAFARDVGDIAPLLAGAGVALAALDQENVRWPAAPREALSVHADPVLGYEGLTRLGSELADVQRDLFKRTGDLEHLQRDRARLMGTIAHDMRNALSIIDTHAHLLAEPIAAITDDDGDAQASLEAITRNSRFLLSMTGDLLELTRLEHGPANLERHPVDLGRLLRERLQDANAVARTKNIDLTFIVAKDLPFIDADEDRIARVIDNLVSNALKFSFPGGSVRVKADTCEEYVRVIVQDEGQGIAEEELDHLFELFFLGKARATGGERSTGLGLPIVQRIVELHDGHIRVDSTLGQGSTFTVLLPVSSAA